MNEVGGNHLVFGVPEDPLEVGLAGLLHGGADLLVAGGHSRLDGQVDHGDGRCRHAEGHSGELALHFGTDQSNGLGRACGRGDDVDGCRAPTLPVLLRGTVHGLLGGRVAVNGGHEPFLNPEAFIEENMNNRCQAVGGAAGVGDDAVLGDIEFVIVDPHHDRDVLILGRCGDDDLLGTRCDMALCFLSFREKSRGLDHHVHAEILPRKSRGALLHGKALDLVSVDHEGVVLFHVGG